MIRGLIDPGHCFGNANSGQTGYKEYEGVWKISTFLKENLESNGVQIDFTRAWSEDPEVYERGLKAQGYDFFISEHTNAMSLELRGTARGVECYYDFNKPGDMIIANQLAMVGSNIMGNVNLGAKIKMYKDTDGKDKNYYGVIRGAASTNCKHIFLIESGFHDNLEDEAFLKSDENLKKIAVAQAEVILKYFGLEMSIDDALKVFTDKGIMNTPTYWKNAVGVVKNLDGLLIKTAMYLK